MELGQYYHSNEKRLAKLKEADWKIALAKCEDHIKWKLRQRTLYGVHSSSQLGADPVDHYLSLAYEKLISGDWEFKDDMDLTEQMIRIINSYISKAVEHASTGKAEALKIAYTDIEHEFYEDKLFENPDHITETIAADNQHGNRIKAIEDIVNGDIELEILWDAVKEGKKRIEIAALLDKTPRQFDKLRDKLIRKVKNQQSVTE